MAWLVVYLYNRYVLSDRPRMRVLLVSIAIGLPLFAELGNYAIFWLRPGAETTVGNVMSHLHQSYLQPLQIDIFLSSQTLLLISSALCALMFVSLLRFIYGSYRLHQGLQIAIPLPDTEYAPLQSRFEQIAVEHGISIPSVEVIPLQAPLAFTTGLIRPRIYITESLLALLTADETMAVFCHELAHVHRHDNLWNWVIRILRDVVWFVPFSHIGWKWMVTSQDEDCDAMAVRLTKEPLALARALVKVAGAWTKAELPPLISATAFAAARTDITSRVEQMIALVDDSRRTSWRTLVGAYMIAAALPILAVLPSLLGS
ncbi:M56 family metallopeptidase [Chloroflexales bacterium ZM16-3]|nr:M56 family metallopeptidase [Chloroflexales bacterium ZM16-3]